MVDAAAVTAISTTADPNTAAAVAAAAVDKSLSCLVPWGLHLPGTSDIPSSKLMQLFSSCYSNSMIEETKLSSPVTVVVDPDASVAEDIVY